MANPSDERLLDSLVQHYPKSVGFNASWLLAARDFVREVEKSGLRFTEFPSQDDGLSQAVDIAKTLETHGIKFTDLCVLDLVSWSVLASDDTTERQKEFARLGLAMNGIRIEETPDA